MDNVYWDDLQHEIDLHPTLSFMVFVISVVVVVDRKLTLSIDVVGYCLYDGAFTLYE